ncbi:hypothetical protein LF41_1325 [Lysobacter dokdonensis DS-58]|uniref:DUF4215 domain-containing protein n=1 Tax=Lysobacter dokdonensis DS-58 TaxID=1300345 RepID=A0A0A2WR61_9GAMM|nr:FG-GAP-like repeat-containing protein [Lysobacter dokdonensis]KGQ20785.1 hypothetical protein LF41_1325 [Lysobacter dokdonensis DS-58]
MRTNTGDRRGWFKAAWLAGFLLLVLGPAQATFHLMKIVEIFPGTAASPQAQYIVLQMYAPGQNLVGGHDLVFYNAANQMTASFVFPNNVPNGANQSRILIATPQAAAFFNVAADVTMPAALISAGGKVCFADSIDCVAWGAFAGPPAGVGTPFNASGGLTSGRAAVRRLNISGGATSLEATDDTDNCANDFAFGNPVPRNNAGQSGMTPASTCGNGTVEGLEQCDDGNTNNGDACSSTCLVTSAPPYRPYADFNGDARADIAWRNSSSGANAIWRSGNAATQQAVASVPNTTWHVVGIGDFDGDGMNDLLWRNSSSGANSIWRGGNAATQIVAATVPASSWKVVGVGDFDGDARSDIAWRNDVSGQNTIWRSGNAASQIGVNGVPNLQWRIVGVGDFNGDGRSDLLWRNTATGGNTIWRSGSAATQQAVATVGTQWTVAGVGDFNNNAMADIFWRNSANGANVIWPSANAGAASAAALTNNTWHVEAVADYDGDRRADVLWRNSSSGADVIWRSGNAATSQAIASVPNQTWTVVP